MRPLATILALLCLAAAPAASGEHYADPAGRFSLARPARWTANASNKGGLTVFTAPIESKKDIFQETLGVAVEAGAATLAEARSSLSRRMKSRGAVLCDSDGRVTLAGRPAHRFTWLLDAGGLRASVVQFLTVDAGRLFVVTCTTQTGHEHIYRDAQQAMLDSFEIDPPTTKPSESSD